MASAADHVAGRGDRVGRTLVQFDLLKTLTEGAADDASNPFQLAIVLQQGRINLDAIAHSTAQQSRNRHSGKFAPDVP